MQPMLRVIVEAVLDLMEHGIDTPWKLLDGTPIRSHIVPVACVAPSDAVVGVFFCGNGFWIIYMGCMGCITIRCLTTQTCYGETVASAISLHASSSAGGTTGMRRVDPGAVLVCNLFVVRPGGI